MTAGAGRLRNDWRGWVLVGSLIACTVAAVLVPPMPQPLSYHAFADCRTFWSIPNFFNVVSNLPFLIGGGLGLAVILRGGGNFIEQREALPYIIFFLGALLTSFGSAYYHWSPDNATLVLTQYQLRASKAEGEAAAQLLAALEGLASRSL